VKTRMVLVVSIVTIVLLGSLGVALSNCDSSRSRISRECYEKIDVGMTKEQVEAILGGPPRWEVEAKRPAEEYFKFFHGRPWIFEWWGADGVILVVYHEGIVTRKNFRELPFEPKPPSFWEVMFPWTRKVRISSA